jgi:hypothetical protein
MAVNFHNLLNGGGLEKSGCDSFFDAQNYASARGYSNCG